MKFATTTVSDFVLQELVNMTNGENSPKSLAGLEDDAHLRIGHLMAIMEVMNISNHGSFAEKRYPVLLDLLKKEQQTPEAAKMLENLLILKDGARLELLTHLRERFGKNFSPEHVLYEAMTACLEVTQAWWEGFERGGEDAKEAMQWISVRFIELDVFATIASRVPAHMKAALGSEAMQTILTQSFLGGVVLSHNAQQLGCNDYVELPQRFLEALNCFGYQAPDTGEHVNAEKLQVSN